MDSSEKKESEIEIILTCLKNNPELRPKIKKGKETPDYNEDYENEVKNKFLQAKNKNLNFANSETIPDRAVSLILGSVNGYDEKKLIEIAKVHKESMTAENMVGNLLEDYIECELKEKGWIRCHGNVVKAVDFIKVNDDNSVRLLQIKNGRTTENSSSDKIRTGTNIEKWYRRDPKNNTDNWVNFPDEEAKKVLNEKGFQNFIVEKMKTIKK